MISGDSIIKCLWSYIEMLFSFYDGGGAERNGVMPGLLQARDEQV